MKSIWIFVFFSIFSHHLHSQQGVDAQSTGINNAVKGTATLGFGVWGISTLNYGVHGQSTSNYGVKGESTSNVGVIGVSFSGYGVRGTTEATLRAGVYGSSKNYGVEGQSPSGIGVYGSSPNGIGVVGSGFLSDFDAVGPGLNYEATSSRRWKRNIVNIPDPLNMISGLRGVYFDWDSDHGGAHDIGFIAEEIGAVIPEIVAFEENGIDASGMDYSKMTPLLVEAVNAMREEYKEMIRQQEQRIKYLENRLSALDSAQSSLENKIPNSTSKQ